MQVEVDYVGVGCNRTPQAADWYDDHTLAYGAANSVALAQVSEVSECEIMMSRNHVATGPV